jgi:hypothetical protein
MPVTTAPMPMSTGLMSMTRVMRIVSSVVGASKPGATIGTKTGAKIAITRLSPASAISTRLMTLLASCHASRSCPRARYPAKTGISAALSAPATTSWKIASGIRKAAK